MKLAFCFLVVFVCCQLSHGSSVPITNVHKFAKRAAAPEAQPILGFGGFGGGYGGGYGHHHHGGYGRGFGGGRNNVGRLLTAGAIVGGAALAGAVIGSSLRGK